MPDDPGAAIFLDTSIQIARRVHAPGIQQSITSRLRGRTRVLSGLIVRQEFKRRLLKEAVYLLKQLEERKSYEKVRRHVQDSLPQLQNRKMKICLQMLTTVDETDSDDDRYDRARLMLRDLIKNGIATAEAHLAYVNLASGCACAMQPIIEKKPFQRYEFGGDRCSKTANCGIRKFLEENRETLKSIKGYLDQIPRTGEAALSTELVKASDFIQRFLDNPQSVFAEDPCLTVGDLLIALESLGCATMYTMNFKESQHLARALNQSMIVRSPNPDKPEVEYRADDAEWKS